ncbi:hypothetical protein AO843_21140 [Lysinibacillus sp. ZYM-1]|nr:hypothetical protein AO843_21140 [Lysinibacillus sp. ZYM-1]
MKKKSEKPCYLFVLASLCSSLYHPSGAMSPTELYQAKHLGKNRVEFLLDHMNSETNQEASAQL